MKRIRTEAVFLALLLAGLCLSVPAAGQEGHPLTGAWYGEWGPEGARRQITIVMSWDGVEVTGIMDPGPYSASVKAELDSTNWTVQIAAVGEDASGSTVTYMADGTMEDPGSRSRTISGTWRAGDTSSSFSVTRED